MDKGRGIVVKGSHKDEKSLTIIDIIISLDELYYILFCNLFNSVEEYEMDSTLQTNNIKGIKRYARLSATCKILHDLMYPKLEMFSKFTCKLHIDDFKIPKISRKTGKSKKLICHSNLKYQLCQAIIDGVKCDFSGTCTAVSNYCSDCDDRIFIYICNEHTKRICRKQRFGCHGAICHECETDLFRDTGISFHVDGWTCDVCDSEPESVPSLEEEEEEEEEEKEERKCGVCSKVLFEKEKEYAQCEECTNWFCKSCCIKSAVYPQDELQMCLNCFHNHQDAVYKYGYGFTRNLKKTKATNDGTTATIHAKKKQKIV
jgi:hypothetical protein